MIITKEDMNLEIAELVEFVCGDGHVYVTFMNF